MKITRELTVTASEILPNSFTIIQQHSYNKQNLSINIRIYSFIQCPTHPALPSISLNFSPKKSEQARPWEIVNVQIKVQQKFKLTEKGNMKKITFVEKEESSTYDPVSTFFANQNKKPSSVAKPINNNPHVQQGRNSGSGKPTGSVERPPSTKASNQTRKVEEKPVTSKIGRKGDHLPPRRPDQQPAGKKQESIYPAGGTSKKNIRANTNQVLEQYYQKQNSKLQNIQLQPNPKQQLTLPHVNQKRSPTKPPPPAYSSPYEQEAPSKPPQPRQQASSSQLQSLRKRIKELQANEQEYTRKIEDLEAREQRFVKIEQKYNKLLKEHKLCGGDKQAGKKLKQKQEELKKVLSKQQIPYNKKRELLLMNQLSNLKKLNRQLTTRIKNYKGTDLVQVSIAQNKTDVLFKEYDHSMVVHQEGGGSGGQGDGEGEKEGVDLARLESLAYRAVQIVEGYMAAKAVVRQGKQLSWAQQKKTLLQLLETHKQFSLECLSQTWQLPPTNKTSTSLYNEIELYRNSLEPLLNKHDLNFIITEENIELINRSQEDIGQLMQVRDGVVAGWIEKERKFRKIGEAVEYYRGRFRGEVAVYQRQYNMGNIVLAHCLAHIAYLQASLTRATTSLKQSLTNLGVRLKELQQLCSLGEAGKEALYLYVQANIKELAIRVPQLQIQMKEVGAVFRNVRHVGRSGK